MWMCNWLLLVLVHFQQKTLCSIISQKLLCNPLVSQNFMDKCSLMLHWTYAFILRYANKALAWRKQPLYSQTINYLKCINLPDGNEKMNFTQFEIESGRFRIILLKFVQIYPFNHESFISDLAFLTAIQCNMQIFALRYHYRQFILFLYD